MDTGGKDKLLTFIFRLDDLTITEITNESSDFNADIKIGSTTINNLFKLRKRDISFIRENPEFITILSTISNTNSEKPYLLSINKPKESITAVCTVIPRGHQYNDCRIAVELLQNIENGQHDQFTPILPSPLLIMNTDSEIEAANRQMFDLFSLNETNICGVNFGNIFKCSAANETNQKCGSFSHCLNCNLRNGITEVLEGRLSELRAETDFEYITESGSEIMRLKVTAASITFQNVPYIAVSLIRL